jgi:uncharacterized protein (DUF1778 family)
MPRTAVEDNSRLSIRIRAEEKALLLRAVALKHTDLTDFVIRHALRAAKAVIEAADHVHLSERIVCGFSTCWRIRLRRTQDCALPLGSCRGGHNRDRLARRTDRQEI